MNPHGNLTGRVRLKPEGETLRLQVERSLFECLPDRGNPLEGRYRVITGWVDAAPKDADVLRTLFAKGYKVE
jgi:hypothetical protein